MALKAQSNPLDIQPLLTQQRNAHIKSNAMKVKICFTSNQKLHIHLNTIVVNFVKMNGPQTNARNVRVKSARR